MLKVFAKVEDFGLNTKFIDIYKKVSESTDRLLLVKKDFRFVNVDETLQEDSMLEFFTIRDKKARKAYENTVVFLFNIAFSKTMNTFYPDFKTNIMENVDVFKKLDKLSSTKIDSRKLSENSARFYNSSYVEFSTGNGLYISIDKKIKITKEFVTALKEDMQEVINSKKKIIELKEDANWCLEFFKASGMKDREILFKYRGNSNESIYVLEDFLGYFVGGVVLDLESIYAFDLMEYKDGFIILIPHYTKPDELPYFKPTDKIFDRLMKDTLWGQKLNMSDIGSLNECITLGNSTELLLMAEATMEKNIGDIAQEIAKRDKVKLVMIAGPSSSGKTTFSYRLSSQLLANGFVPHPVAVDNYFKDRAETPKDEQGNYDFESLRAIDVEKLNEDIARLLEGESVQMPRFNFKTGQREQVEILKLGKEDILVIEGIHCLNDELLYKLPKEFKYKIYISALTQLNIDANNRINTTDGRLLRRMVRDSENRGINATSTLEMWNSVRKGEDENIFPYQESADVVFNSALIYELAILKPYAQNLLYSVLQESKEYDEAKRLLDFLDYFLVIPSENVLRNSILREFIGGSIFNV